MRVAICAEQWLFASVLAAAFDGQGHEVVIATDDPRQLPGMAGRLDVDVCVLDAPPAAVESLFGRGSRPFVVLLADAHDEAAWDAYDRGLADGIVSKACDLRTVSWVVQSVAHGNRIAEGRPTQDRRRTQAADLLTTRELEVLRLVVRGLSTEEMANELGVSRHTVRTHVQQVLRKLGVHGRGKIAGAAAAAGLGEVRDLLTGGHP
ncbi:helix-turn-helix transcriptional regulator [Kribbella solani]|uniref:DNA-binding NarL/FixJ family response regulator n=1 Tax=Kribbella solani TaxID=236067 RepID=A0A841DKD7_9ACTN|nr:response regulator transcription factor [Kribbella solani]MBB5978361.1 DNA-binding NarL/FixJ family response regulator [Kribbella solani]